MDKKRLNHGYVVGGHDEDGPFLLGVFDDEMIARERYEEATRSTSWVADYRDTLYIARLVEERLEGAEATGGAA